MGVIILDTPLKYEVHIMMKDNDGNFLYSNQLLEKRLAIKAILLGKYT
jgi:hypothetical protein